ncbi:autophagy-related protein 2 homolog A isoform X2 [Pectinophora gossypiella]|uniref:autophagy-related protein 2 homolog A isoform X2 n=1 Tax=Pectinophora gossypiella TaxID=13191 RepID=UPI00214E705B|nr:autophagy-related protein 2 homolog A isoform X2 [Pectinophora gossypiella]
MLWYLPWSESIKKRACRYLLQRYLGNFLEEKLTLDQLSVDLYNGTGTVSDVSLDCEALNDLGDAQNWPLEIVDGHMQEITVTIPWSTLLKDDSIVEVNGLSLTVQPKVRAEPASSMLESMWSSMSSSMQLAEECLREEDGPQESHPVEGIEMFAHAIDSILSRVKVKFVNTKIRIEHVPKNCERGIALEIHIQNIDYFDEAGNEPTPDVTEPEKTKTYIVATYTNKKIKFHGVTLYTDEFPSKLRTMARSLIMEKSTTSQAEKTESSQIEMAEVNYQSAMSDVFYETRSVISTIEPDPIKEVIDEKPPTEFFREATPEERAIQPDPILFAKLTGQQELALKIKHTEEAEGPKVEVKMLLGSFIFFISPRQLHTLIELVNALNQPHLEDTSNIPLRPTGQNMQCKPMKRADFQLIEAQLLGNLEKETSRPAGMYGWSGPNFEDSDAESERFHPMTSAGQQMGESFCSSVSSMNTSMTSSTNAPSQTRIKRNKKVPHIEGDPTAEVSHISFRIASLSCVLLHKDILATTPMGADCISPSSAYRMQETSRNFFDNLLPYCISEGGGKEFQAANDALDKATGMNHLRLITSEMSLDGSEKLTSHGSQTVCEASIKHLLVRETLYAPIEDGKPESFDLIRFESNEDDENKRSAPRANVRINFKQTSKYMRISGEKKLLYPTTDITVKCTPLVLDVELTVLDRMCATFFNGPPARTSHAPPPPQNQLNFSLLCPELKAVLRFPIADLRAGITRETRRVRPDYLVFQFKNTTFSSQQTPSARPLPTVVTLKATSLDLYYHENDELPATHIARSAMADPMESDVLKGNVIGSLPTISITFQPKKSNKGPFDQLDDEPTFEPASVNPMTTSMYIMNNLQSSQPSPFSGKKTAHQSFTQHENSPQGQEEELIVPGNEEEMAEFTSSSVERSAIHLDFNLPVLSLQLESKQLYEIIYNRINSDLLLWEPQIIDQFEISPLMSGTIYPAFGMCKGSGYESESESSSSEEENLYYSTYDNKLKKGLAAKSVPEKKDEHNFCLTMKVGKGLLTIYAPVRDSNKRVVPGQMGELVLEAHKLSMCQVSGLYGRPKTAQLCLRAGKTTLYHDSLITIPSEKPSLRLYGTALPTNLKSTIYPSGKGVAVKERLATKDMFSLALRVDPDNETPSLKTICIALGIEQATLRHRGDKGIAWLTQLMDVIDVLDYPVPGYTPSTVLSELHVHLWDCAIDYRPLYLPIRTVITLGNFTVSSNLIAATNTSCLRFLAQECTLFLSHLQGTKSNTTVPQDDDKLPDVHKDYICVVDVGLFELSLRMEDKATCTNEQPQVDLSASNNMVTLYTCWDSASALCRLLTYVASDGDSQPPYDPASRHTSICEEPPLEPLVGLEDRPVEEIRELSPSEIQQVNDLMAEALKESPNNTLDEDELNSSTEKEGVEIFFFPDESNMRRRQTSSEAIDTAGDVDKLVDFDDSGRATEEESKPTNAQVAKDLGDLTSTPKASPRKPKRKKKSSGDGSNTDDEYCIIDTQPHSNLDNDLDEPVVNWIGPGPVYMFDNHFTVPAARTDVLKAPKSFPLPMLRYTLCEMSITWNMFGGTDFKPTADSAPDKKRVTIESDARKQASPSAKHKEYEPYESGRALTAAYRQGVSWSAGSERVRPGPRAPPKSRDLRTRGGPLRDHHTCVKLCLSKLKFQHEVYPQGGTHASRQTLAVSKIEVLDRLVCSDINKLLSQYKLKDEPERKNAHMLIVKAVHLRPLASLSAQECCLKVALLPLRFNLDQDTLAFLVGFFSKLGTDESNDDDTKSVGGLSTESSGSRQTTPTHRVPVMSIAPHLRDPPPTPTSLGDADALSLNDAVIRDEEPLMETYEAERLVSENLIQLEEDFHRLGISQEKPYEKAKLPDNEPIDDSPIYFRRVVFSPEVPIRLDYVGKRVDLSAGPVAGLLMGLGQLNCSELTLKRLDYRLGLLGLEKLVQWALHEWLSDIKRHQLPGLLSGIGPMHSLLQLITGIRDLVWLPVEQWRRDGRLVHGLRRGAASFTARTAVAALDITTRILHLIQATAETAFDMLTPSPTLALQDAYKRRERRRRRRHDPARHPTDIREGVASAYNTVREGFAETAATMALAARCESGVGVLRHLPGAAVAPLALAAAGAADVLGGVRAHLAPHAARDTADKWRADTQT